MQNIRSGSNLDRFEYRAGRYGALNLFSSESENPAGIITPELIEKAAASIGSTLQTPVIDFDGGITIGNQRLVAIADSENTSQIVDVSFATYAWGFTVVPAVFHNNEVALQKDFETKLMKYLYLFAATLDSAGVAALETAKSRIFANRLLYGLAGDTNLQ